MTSNPGGIGRTRQAASDGNHRDDPGRGLRWASCPPNRRRDGPASRCQGCGVPDGCEREFDSRSACEGVVMSCPPDIADVLLEILTTGILRIRSMGRSEHSSLEADHLHNLPALLQNYSPELLQYYWEVERPSFIRRCASCAQFEPLW